MKKYFILKKRFIYQDNFCIHNFNTMNEIQIDMPFEMCIKRFANL